MRKNRSIDVINGIALEKYTELRVMMKDVIDNKEKCASIAHKQGVDRKDWEAAHKGWQEKITDPADMGKTASRFVDLWNIKSSRREKKL